MGVAFSGGRDSLALLHATVRAAHGTGLEVVALHVHHGLVAEADAWVQSAIALCHRWQRAGWPVRLRWHRVQGQPARGQSVEAWARRQRYEALARMAQEEGASLVLLAQHRRDQAETVLLQALRGAGARGLAAMPRLAVREGLSWARPWLDQPREAIESYVRRHRLKPLEDPSNDDTRLARNRLRAQVWPALTVAFHDAETTLAQSARRAQETSAVLDEVAALDLATLVKGPSLQRAPWLALSTARRANVLRAWLRAQCSRGAPEAMVQQLLHDWARRAQGQWTVAPGQVLVAYRGRLRWRVPEPEHIRGPACLDLSRPGCHAVPQWGGAFLVEPGEEQGIDAARLVHAELRPRSGGERFQRGPATPPRSLKKSFQQAGLAVDQRQGPLVWSGDQLVFVPGLGIDARAWASPGQPQLHLRWLPTRG
ncbi:MAG: tRNA lysidine(34) synthetase TilS [Burkholderiales bacterium]|nr:tRNA lysidine(34) synthetase TilS [Burkholderiales bacterium]